jgi:hypothetical protein
VNLSFFLCLAACRTRSSAWVTRTRLRVRRVLCSPAFLLVPALGSTGSAAVAPALFVGFTATTAVSDFSRSCIIGYGSSPSRCGPGQHPARWLLADREISRFPNKKRLHMPGSATTPDRPGARDIAPVRVAFHGRNCVGIRDDKSFAARWLAYALPYRRFADILADACARLGVNVDRYSFTERDLHPLLLAGFAGALRQT